MFLRVGVLFALSSSVMGCSSAIPLVGCLNWCGSTSESPSTEKFVPNDGFTQSTFDSTRWKATVVDTAVTTSLSAGLSTSNTMRFQSDSSLTQTISMAVQATTSYRVQSFNIANLVVKLTPSRYGKVSLVTYFDDGKTVKSVIDYSSGTSVVGYSIVYDQQLNVLFDGSSSPTTVGDLNSCQVFFLTPNTGGSETNFDVAISDNCGGAAYSTIPDTGAGGQDLGLPTYTSPNSSGAARFEFNLSTASVLDIQLLSWGVSSYVGTSVDAGIIRD